VDFPHWVCHYRYDRVHLVLNLTALLTGSKEKVQNHGRGTGYRAGQPTPLYLSFPVDERSESDSTLISPLFWLDWRGFRRHARRRGKHGGFSGLTAMITGAGQALARHAPPLAERGAKVVLMDKNRRPSQGRGGTEKQRV